MVMYMAVTDGHVYGCDGSGLVDKVEEYPYRCKMRTQGEPEELWILLFHWIVPIAPLPS
jgi:hypothetical protein